MAGQTRKETAWKKSRKFGDVKGGRMRPKLADNIFNRCHSLLRPAADQSLPIVMHENPSRDFFFPVTSEDVLNALAKLPQEDVQGLTHLWFRRIRNRVWEEAKRPLAEFICGSGVRLIVLYPWPVARRISFGKRRPHGKVFKWYARWAQKLVQEDGQWWLLFNDESLARLYIEGLVLHEVGHHVDWYHRHWSKANRKVREEFADQYAVQWSTAETFVWNECENEL